ncbi:hypothetical protein niasHS_007314 [Heterodera schachtii]|uniref:Uncharacterized protein n=1 Tax=Heterodera schachtii TaxID=97005 RepID=A0ABD2JKC3_HETSC
MIANAPSSSPTFRRRRPILRFFCLRFPPFPIVLALRMPSSAPSLPPRHSFHPQKGNSLSSPPGSSSTSTVPIAELVNGDTSKALSVDRCVYFEPQSSAREKVEEDKFGEREQQKGLRPFFFGDSPKFRRPPHSFPSQFDGSSICVDANAPISPSFTAIRAVRPMLARKRTFGGNSHSSRTISMDFDSETSEETERTNYEHRKCNRKAEKQTMGTHNANRTEQKQRNQTTESPIVVARQQQMQQSQFNGAQFDTQSLQSRSRSRSIGNSQNPNSLPPNVCHHRQHSSGGFRHGSCTNLSALDGSNNGTAAAAGPLVLYNGGVIDGECSPTTMAPHRHSMALIDPPMPSPFWCHQPMLHPHAPPPPFYYSAATLPHPPPPPPMDLVTFRRALKESERMEKERQMLAGERGVCAACCDFCCGGSAVLLWLVLTLVALGFLSFLLIAIYFL